MTAPVPAYTVRIVFEEGDSLDHNFLERKNAQTFYDTCSKMKANGNKNYQSVKFYETEKTK